MEYVVEFESIEKKYLSGTSEVKALRGMDLQIRRGEFVALTGPSGCGKSTALNLIACIDLPTKGGISVFGKDPRAMTDKELSYFRREKIGIIFQNFNLLPIFSCLENVTYPLILKKESQAIPKGKALLEKVGLQEFMHLKPGELSGGQKQRCAIARAFANSPDLIIADEPTANLDSQNSEQVIQLIFEFIREFQTTFIAVSHQESFYSRADRFLTMKDGVVLPAR